MRILLTILFANLLINISNGQDGITPTLEKITRCMGRSKRRRSLWVSINKREQINFYYYGRE
jgi:hypothetical protein